MPYVKTNFMSKLQNYVIGLNIFGNQSSIFRVGFLQ